MEKKELNLCTRLSHKMKKILVSEIERLVRYIIEGAVVLNEVLRNRFLASLLYGLSKKKSKTKTNQVVVNLEA